MGGDWHSGRIRSPLKSRGRRDRVAPAPGETLLRAGSRSALLCRLDVAVGVLLKKEPLSHELSRRFFNRFDEPSLGSIALFERGARVSARLSRCLRLRK